MKKQFYGLIFPKRDYTFIQYTNSLLIPYLLKKNIKNIF